MRFNRVAQFTLFFLSAASKDVFATSDFNLTPGVTPTSHDIYNLHMTVFWVCVVIGVIVFGTMIYSIIHFRKSKGVVAAQFHEHLWLEITWTIIPFLILIALAIPATIVLLNLNDPSRPDLTVKVTAFQWKWRYEYLEKGISFFSNLSTPMAQRLGQSPKDENYLREVDKPLVLPIHKKIRFLVTGNDVVHAWWVPDFGVKKDAVPGFINESWAKINKPGVYRGQCAELCGIGHGFMPIVVVAMAEKDFDNWVAQQKGLAPINTSTPANAIQAGQPVAKPAPSKTFTKEELMQKGEQVYLNTCAMCHKPDGTGSPPVFPALKGSATAKGPLPKHLDTVLNGRPGTAMQPFKDQLSDEEIAAVVTYERNAFGNNTGVIVQPSEVEAAKGKK